MSVTSERYGSIHEQDIIEYTLTNDNGVLVRLLNYGGIIRAIHVPDKHGGMENIVLSYPSLRHYQNDLAYIGCIVGRYANRIKEGRFCMDGHWYQLDCNDGQNHLHGGNEGFHKKMWHHEPYEEQRGCGVKLFLISPDDDQGFPGTLDVEIGYLLTGDNELIVEYGAATDRKTIVNLTQHSYFNLAGNGTIHDHLITMKSPGYLPVDENLIPTGEVRTVENTVFDLQQERRLGDLLSPQRKHELVDEGFDHTFILDPKRDPSEVSATLYHPDSGRLLEVSTTEPGLHLYTANTIHQTGSEDVSIRFPQHAAVCLECQHFPDSPNHDSFPSVVLEPGQIYRQETRYIFSIREED